ncbi:serine--tRNA ligase [Candidatus Acetothermia bacterium]|jgi:seryl-tRNA synthetase|nr:serine--tRNA ligase [Candidatus Acetothermia bacterium]MCI2427310.1 serine--tRNA ligase [Candidatus Acetothermia bacterium]
MLDIQKIRADRAAVEAQLRKRDSTIDLAEITALDQRRTALITMVEELKSRRNTGSQRVGQLKKTGCEQEANELIEEMHGLVTQITALDGQLRDVNSKLDHLLSLLPNLPHASVPVGKKEDKIILRSWGEPSPIDAHYKNHAEIGEELNLLDFKRGAMIAGTRFPIYKGLGAQLEMALIQFMLSTHIRNGYIPIIPPLLANPESFFVASQLPKFADDLYYCETDNLFLTPTAESLLVNLHRSEILRGDDLPLKYVAYTPCFRREAGTYGEEERGLIRLHQFNKVELFKFTTPESSYDELEHLLVDAEMILQALNIHYRVALLPTTDMAQQASKTIDIEIFIPAQGRYYEVSSCSNCEDFQARRGAIRCRSAVKDKPRFVHTLNGSGLATSRIFAAILEYNYQDGKIIIPEVLRPLVGTETIP